MLLTFTISSCRDVHAQCNGERPELSISFKSFGFSEKWCEASDDPSKNKNQYYDEKIY